MSAADVRNRGHTALARQAWAEAYTLLSAADAKRSLEPDDLQPLAEVAYLTGRDAEALDLWTRAYHARLDRGEIGPAARCGFWLSHNLLLAGNVGQSRGWLARTQQLLDDAQADCAERGYLLLVVGLYTLGEGDAAGSYSANDKAGKIAARFGDHDLATLALLCRGKALLELGETAEALDLLDEAIVAVTAGEVSPMATGIVYCAAILACRSVFDLGRASEWTQALGSWCDGHPDLVPFRGQCLVHRSELMQLRGDWPAAMDEARRACAWLSEPRQPTLALAMYQRAELHRLRGEVEPAEDAYRQASDRGIEPQPGLSQLRLVQGRVAPAAAAIRRALNETSDARARSRLLGPAVEILLADDDPAAAREAADELAASASELAAPALLATSAQARGSVLLAEGDTAAALPELRRAWALWRALDAPYEAARARVQIGRACLQLGDRDTAKLHFDAARQTFTELGAAIDAAALDDPVRGSARPAGGVSRREREVLALVAAGRTNRAIAEELVISEKTVERHLSNIFTKLEVSNRAAATAFALDHGLV